MNKKEDGTLEEIEQPFMLQAQEETVIIENCQNMRPVAALVNSGNQGYARVLLDDSSIQYFLDNISSLKSQADRTQTWGILDDHVRMCRVSPAAFIKAVVDHIGAETEQRTLFFIIGKVEYILLNFIEDGQKGTVSEQLFDVLLKKCQDVES